LQEGHRFLVHENQSVNMFAKKSVGYRRRTRPATECLPWKLVNGL